MSTNSPQIGNWTIRGLRLILVVIAAGVGAIPAHSSSALELEAVSQARLIRAEVSARYRLLPGRKLFVTEATSTESVESLTLIIDWAEPWRVVPADNGIYFAICSERANCAYSARFRPWPVEALLPRRMAAELVLRTFLETSATLVVVALPTARPAWVVVERDDFLGSVDAHATLDRLASRAVVVEAELVDRIIRPRLFVPLPILPPPDDTIYAVRLSDDPAE